MNRKFSIKSVACDQYPYAITPNVSAAKLKRRLVFRDRGASVWCVCLSVCQTHKQFRKKMITVVIIIIVYIFRRDGRQRRNGSLAVRGFRRKSTSGTWLACECIAIRLKCPVLWRQRRATNNGWDKKKSFKRIISFRQMVDNEINLHICAYSKATDTKMQYIQQVYSLLILLLLKLFANM